MNIQTSPLTHQEDFLDDIDVDAEIRVIRSPGGMSAFCQSKAHLFGNPKISFTAKGIYMFLHEQNISSLSALMQIVPDPESEIRSGLEELKEFKYVSFDGIDLITVIR